MTPGSNREPPHNLEAEQALLGAILINNRAYERVAGFLRAEHFADPVNGRIFDACARAIDAGRIATPVTLKGIFDHDEALQGDGIGGGAYLIRLAASVVTVINAEDYGREILDCFQRRELIDIGDALMADAFDRGSDHDGTSAAIQRALGALDTVAAGGAVSRELEPLADGLAAALHNIQEAQSPDGKSGISTGITDLDRALGLLRPGRQVIMGARPAMGKTALALAIADHAARRHGPVAFFSLEMEAPELAARLLARQTGISQERQEAGDVDRNDFSRLEDARRELADIPLFVDDTPASTVHDIRRRAARLRRRHGLVLIVVDYLQLIAAGNTRENRVQNRNEDLTGISAGLLAVAKELGVPLLALSQLSRSLEAREDKRPMLSDLRESGAIEQDAWAVIFPYRDEYYVERAEPKRRPDESDDKYSGRVDAWEQRLQSSRNVMEVIVAKRRGGRTGKADLWCDMAAGRFSNLHREQTNVGE